MAQLSETDVSAADTYALSETDAALVSHLCAVALDAIPFFFKLFCFFEPCLRRRSRKHRHRGKQKALRIINNTPGSTKKTNRVKRKGKQNGKNGESASARKKRRNKTREEKCGVWGEKKQGKKGNLWNTGNEFPLLGRLYARAVCFFVFVFQCTPAVRDRSRPKAALNDNVLAACPTKKRDAFLVFEARRKIVLVFLFNGN